MFLHRDFHPGNVLWTDGAVTRARRLGERGDRARARRTPATAAGTSPGRSGRTPRTASSPSAASPYHPYWDVVAALGGYDAAELAAKPPAEEAFLAAAVRPA